MINFEGLNYYCKSIWEISRSFNSFFKIFFIFLFNRRGEHFILKFKGSEIQMVTRSRMDIWSVKETFIDQYYSPAGFEIQPDWIVVDIGAAIGEFSVFAGKSAIKGRVFALEPFSESYELLLKNIALNNLDNVEAFNKAIWSGSGNVYINTTNKEPLQFESEFEPENYNKNLIYTDALSLCDLLNNLKINRVDLLKLDCEGAEFPIFLDSSQPFWEKIQRIVMEFHDGYHNHHHLELIELLKKKNYQVSVVRNKIHDNLGYIYAKKL